MVSGCFQRRNLQADNTVKVVLPYSKTVAVWASAWEKNGVLTVGGTVRPRKPRQGAERGHVHITVTDVKGNEIATETIEHRSLKKQKRVPDSVRYTALFPVVPPRRSTIRIGWHAGFDCSE